MNVTKRSIFLSFGFIALAVLLYFISIRLLPAPKKQEIELPTFIATTTDGVVYDEQGRILRKMLTDETIYYEKDTFYKFNNPFSSTYNYKNDGKLEIWNLKSKTGTMLTDKFITADEDVIITPGFKETSLKDITADDFYYDLEKNLITSKSEVIVTSVNGSNTRGTEFSFDVNKNIAKYQGDPHATYIPAKK